MGTIQKRTDWDHENLLPRCQVWLGPLLNSIAEGTALLNTVTKCERDRIWRRSKKHTFEQGTLEITKIYQSRSHSLPAMQSTLEPVSGTIGQAAHHSTTALSEMRGSDPASFAGWSQEAVCHCRMLSTGHIGILWNRHCTNQFRQTLHVVL